MAQVIGVRSGTLSNLERAMGQIEIHASRVHETYHMAKPYPVVPDWRSCNQRTCAEMRAIWQDILYHRDEHEEVPLT